MTLKVFLGVFLGGGIGATLRFFLSTLISPSNFWSTSAINVFGAFLAGLFFRYFEINSISNEARLFVMVGFLGAFTTFSAFALDFFHIMRDENYSVGFLYVFITVTGTILGFSLGFRMIS